MLSFSGEYRITETLQSENVRVEVEGCAFAGMLGAWKGRSLFAFSPAPSNWPVNLLAEEVDQEEVEQEEVG